MPLVALFADAADAAAMLRDMLMIHGMPPFCFTWRCRYALIDTPPCCYAAATLPMPSCYAAIFRFAICVTRVTAPLLLPLFMLLLSQRLPPYTLTRRHCARLRATYFAVDADASAATLLRYAAATPLIDAAAIDGAATMLTASVCR